MTVLDEPSAKQSDPSVLDLQLRAVMKQSAQKSVVIKKIESGEKNSKAIDKWIKDISDLHRSKPPPTVHYNKPMPDLDQLMQEWPMEFENLLKSMNYSFGLFIWNPLGADPLALGCCCWLLFVVTCWLLL